MMTENEACEKIERAIQAMDILEEEIRKLRNENAALRCENDILKKKLDRCK